MHVDTGGSGFLSRIFAEVAVDDRNPSQYLKDPKLWELWYVPYYG